MYNKDFIFQGNLKLKTRFRIFSCDKKLSYPSWLSELVSRAIKSFSKLLNKINFGSKNNFLLLG